MYILICFMDLFSRLIVVYDIGICNMFFEDVYYKLCF